MPCLLPPFAVRTIYPDKKTQNFSSRSKVPDKSTDILVRNKECDKLCILLHSLILLRKAAMLLQLP